jgi:hypothetical protein
MLLGCTEYLGGFLGDRFYESQLKATGDCPGNPKNKGKPPKALTKPEMVELLGVKGLTALTIKDLKILVASWEDIAELELPTGRLKYPYVDQLASWIPEVDWARCTVATLTDTIKYKMTS